MKTIDLHTHSIYSDGTYTPKEIMEWGKRKGISAIALTDHDTFDGLDEAEKWGGKYGIEVIRGIEVSAEYEGTEIHIVGLFVNSENDEFDSVLKKLRMSRKNRNTEMVEKLNNIGINIKYEDVVKRAEGGIVTRAHIAREVINKGYALTNNEVFERYIGKDKPAYVKRQVLPWTDAIRLINESGGLAVLAHPLIYKLTEKRLEMIIGELAKEGLAGIEAYYSTHSDEDISYIKSAAKKYNLRLSGGSDFHGANKPKIDLGTGYGNLKVPYWVLQELKDERDIRYKKGDKNA